MDTAQMLLLQAQANVAVAEAALQTAQINLDNTVIRAEIPGLIGRSSVSVGSLVTANQTTALATIRQIDSVYVDLTNSSADLLRMRAQAAAGNLGRIDRGTNAVHLTLEDGSAYGQTGTISLAEVVVSETTGTYSVRATFSNPRRLLMPGMFVRATIGVGISPEAFLVPQRAVTRNANGEPTAYFVTADNTAQARPLVTDRAIGNDWLVTDGIVDGDRVIVDRLQQLEDGLAVLPLPVQIDSDGVVRQEISNVQPGAKVAGDS
jgi:membrane fusion protein (multidrug efflux system)